MSIHVKLTHVTHYRYDRLVGLSPQIVRLRPAPHCRTPILSYSQTITPDEHFLNWQQDPQANYMARLVFPEKTREFCVTIDLVAEMSVINPFDFFLDPSAKEIPFQYDAETLHELAPYCIKLKAEPKFAAYMETISREATPSVDFLVALTQRLQGDVNYLIRMEPGVQTPEETLTLGSGSCRDSAWLMVQVLRHLGLAARFVSGYLIQLKPDVKSLDGPSGADEDFTDLHAWCEVYLPGAGWVGLDATSGLFAGEGHIPLACTPNPSSAAPVFGYSDDCECEFEHIMKVERVWEAPRVTKPYSDAQWSQINRLGRQIDTDLVANDVRLTMGGEPTFVSVDDREGAEWSTEAMGPTKRLLGADLLYRLKEKYAEKGLLHYGQGKWYPGEQLPRWSLSCFWRKDGEPVWHDTALYADEHKDYGADDKTAGLFLAELARTLEMDPKFVFPAFEDAWYYLWRERKLPVNVDPFDARLEDPLERERLRKVFHQGLDKAVGHILPIARNPIGDARWQTGPWFLRAERCYLVPGDSPLGYRLPLDAQPWVSKSDYPYLHATDPSAPQSALPLHGQIRRMFQAPGMSAAERNAIMGGQYADAKGKMPAHLRAQIDEAKRPAHGQSASWITRTAMCAQPRDGRLYLFMPPLQALEDYLELCAAIESVAEKLDVPVILEGYEPPKDPRLEQFRITPDPGVLEVNIHPAADWPELVERTTHLYEQAHLSRLTTEKFMVDGRHTGTGGGNHFVFGGASVADSPFLRRPDLLRSLISYWHNHPSLSYLFSGLFVGPTSQAPRIDEARNDSVYEIETAFQQIPPAGKAVPPWTIDRILRNLLVDSTGNTHRSEFCIDKLYSPDGPTGRLGLLELRAFEMPPHAQMSLAQQLLLRGLIGRFWQQPYEPERLTRWGTGLHDRFMLPYFIENDFADVVDELQDFGYDFEADWFSPHLEFRFPKIGDFAVKGAEFELRAALEPWHVMGEEGSAGGNVRYVDSSLERIQVHVTGLAPDRYRLVCNGRTVPLTATGKHGEYVAGVRYKAWAPPSALHPTIPSHNPLVFDLVDTWMSRSMGGCSYSVSHPGGRSHEDYPVNAYAAEGRRLARFTRLRHTPGHITAAEEALNPNFPFTLDLRRR